MHGRPISWLNDTSSNDLIGGSELLDHQSVDRLLFQKKPKLAKAAFCKGLYLNEVPKEKRPERNRRCGSDAKTSKNAELDL